MVDPRPFLLSDDKLLAQCRMESFVASGPGGQKRHKTNAAVRVTHLPTKTSAVATDSRSHRENQIHAIRELRHKLALELRREIADTIDYRPPEYFVQYPGLKMNPKNPLYPPTVAEVLDVLQAMHWEVSRSAVLLGVSTSALTHFLYQDAALWVKVNDQRAQLGLPALRWR